MQSNKIVKLGDVIHKVNVRNSDGKVRRELRLTGEKSFKVTHSLRIDNTSDKVIKRGQFAADLIKVTLKGDRLAIALLEDYDEGLLSSAYSLFEVNDENELLPKYLMILFRLPDFRHIVWSKTDSSVRGGIEWERFCEIEFPLPSIEKQKEYVAIYSNLLELSKNHEKSFDELQKLTDLFMDAMVEKYESKEIGNYIELVNKRNKGGFITDVRGVNIDKEFMPSVANLSGVDLSKYKIVDNNRFATNLMHVGRDERLPISLNSSGKPIIVSPAYFTFKMKDDANVLPEYLFLFMKRPETERYAGFICDSSVRGNLEWSRFIEIRIPVPPIDVQESIVAVHNALEMRKSLNERIKVLIKEISPVLIKNAKDLCGEN